MKNLSQIIALALTMAVSQFAFSENSNDPKKPEVFEVKIHFTKEAAKDAARAAGHGHTSSPLLLYHNGPVLLAANTAAIFWGNSWNNAAFAGDKISGMDAFFNGFGGSAYAHTSNEYSDGAGNYITANATYSGHVIDSSAPPSRALTVSQAVAEVCKITANNPNSNTAYFIYTSTGAGNVNYCAWHSYGTCSNGAKVQVAYHPNLDGIAGCDPEDAASGNSQGLAALANVTGHELLETITDPRLNAWYDNSGSENADKCAWVFPPGDGLSAFVNGSKYKIQMEWSNAAFALGTGLPNLSGQNACIYQ